MKKYYLTLFIISVVFIGLFFNSIVKPNLGRSFHQAFASSTNLNDENIERLKLFDNIQSKKIVSVYGIQTVQSRNVTGYKYFQLRKGVEVAVNNKGHILRFIVTDDILETAKGIKLGDKGANIKDKYGNDYYFRREQGTDIVGYVDKTRNISIEFWMYDDKVVLIRLDDTSMK